MRLPITLPFHRSPRLTAVMTVAYLLAGAVLFAIELPTVVKVSALAFLVGSLSLWLRRPAQGALVLGTDGRLTLIRGDGSSAECEVDASTTVLPWLVVLRLSTSSGIEALTLPVDALGSGAHRQLRTWLRWKARTSTE